MSELEEKIRIQDLARGERHATIFHKFDTLQLEEYFLLIADHDPKPLYFQFLFERAGQFDWQRVQEGPEWHIRIRRIRDAESGQKPAKEIASCRCKSAKK